MDNPCDVFISGWQSFVVLFYNYVQHKHPPSLKYNHSVGELSEKSMLCSILLQSLVIKTIILLRQLSSIALASTRGCHLIASHSSVHSDAVKHFSALTHGHYNNQHNGQYDQYCDQYNNIYLQSKQKLHVRQNMLGCMRMEALLTLIFLPRCLVFICAHSFWYSLACCSISAVLDEHKKWIPIQVPSLITHLSRITMSCNNGICTDRIYNDQFLQIIFVNLTWTEQCMDNETTLLCR